MRQLDGPEVPRSRGEPDLYDAATGHPDDLAYAALRHVLVGVGPDHLVADDETVRIGRVLACDLEAHDRLLAYPHGLRNAVHRLDLLHGPPQPLIGVGPLRRHSLNALREKAWPGAAEDGSRSLQRFADGARTVLCIRPLDPVRVDPLLRGDPIEWLSTRAPCLVQPAGSVCRRAGPCLPGAGALAHGRTEHHEARNLCDGARGRP
mmetsp:Transcript_21499/g.61429  ORF Transcript_21499/g.61429 Transcript_21499/m.61429 type:complete len:206 (+) Transcript_21499:1331-1948(+)